MTPLIIGQLIDNLADGDPASIVAAGLSMIFEDEIRCEIHNGRCMLYVYGNLLERSQEIADLAMAIPTCDSFTNYTPGNRRFTQCEVFALVAVAEVYD